MERAKGTHTGVWGKLEISPLEVKRDGSVVREWQCGQRMRQKKRVLYWTYAYVFIEEQQFAYHRCLSQKSKCPNAMLTHFQNELW